MKALEKDNSENKLEINNENNKLLTENVIPQRQNKNVIQKENKNSSNSLNAQNLSSNSINNENQSQSLNQNINLFPSNFLSNFPPKEYFNFSFFKRQMSSRSSDIDYYQDNKEGINDFFNTKCKSIYSKDSEKLNNSKKSSELNSFEFNLGNKDENNQVTLIRANSARTKNCISNNYIPKTVFFQRNNSNTQSCFYKKHKIEKQEIKNNNIENNDKNLVLQYYGNNNEFKNEGGVLEMVHDKYDESEEEEDEEKSEEDEEDEDDDCILTKKDNQNFTVNYLSGNGGINLPKATFTLLHRGTNIKLDKEKNKNSENEKSKDKIDDIDILTQKENKKDNNDKNNIIEVNNENINNDNINNGNINIFNPLNNEENENEKENDLVKNNETDNNKEIINKNILNNSINEPEILTNMTKNEATLNINNNMNLINQNQNQGQNNYNSFIYQQNNYSLMNNESLIKNMNSLNLMNNNNLRNNRQTSVSQNETEEFLKNAINYIKDQQGCRFIQKKISENPEISDRLFDILYPNIITMSKDLFGNYVIQKILENLKPNYLAKFIELISQDFINISISLYGTRVVQKLLEIVSKPSNISDKEIYNQCFQSINNYITKSIVELSSNNNSSHIIIKYVNEIKYPQNDLLYKEVYNNFVPLCKNKHGCCVIQKCIDFGNVEQKNKLLELSNLNCQNLISDQFGNYVIQFVLSLNVNIINAKVHEILYQNLVPLCKEKYASNVIEKFFINKSKESMDIINILLNNEKYLHELIMDPFGNYIIQRILLIIEGENRTKLIHYIVKWYPEIKSLSFGPRLISKLHERFQEFTLLVTQKYGWDTTQEIASFLYGKPNLNLRNNILPNNMPNNNAINNLNYFRNMNMINNLNNGMNGVYNNNYMNFQNKNNVGNINFIQLNNYMLTNGQNNLRFPMNEFGGFNNFNNINNLNNGQFFSNFGNANYIPNNLNNNIKPNINNNIIQRINQNDNQNINNYFLNNNQNMMNYNQYLKATFSNNKNN